MSGIRSQKLKIRRLVEESDFARIESAVRAEPLVARAKGAAGTVALSKSVFGRMKHSIAAHPTRPYKAMAVSFGVSLLLPFLLGRARKTLSHNNNK
ncbi:MAG: hypothetical protein ACLFRP_02440 [Puniceicoccaceae bacterium]